MQSPNSHTVSMRMLATAEGNDDDEAAFRHRTPLSASTSFFIIQEPSNTTISPIGGPRSAQRPPRRTDEGSSLSTTPQRRSVFATKKKNARKSSPSAPVSPLASATPARTPSRIESLAKRRASTSSVSPVVYEGHEGEEEAAEAETDLEDHTGHSHSVGDVSSHQNKSKTPKKATMELSVLTRCGSAPDLPLHSALSASVYSSAKKRALQISPGGASVHRVALQRSRLLPLPPNLHSGAPKPDQESSISTSASSDDLDQSFADSATIDANSPLRLRPKDPVLQEKLLLDAHTIASLKQRVMLLERKLLASTKRHHVTDKQVALLIHDNQRLQAEKTQLLLRVDDLEKTSLKQRHEFDKLAARYSAVYVNVQKLADQQQLGVASTTPHTVLQALARENQDFLRKLQILEAQRADDKTRTSNQDKRIKRLRAEMEALQHMNDAKLREEDEGESPRDQQPATTGDQPSRLPKSAKRVGSSSSHSTHPGSASSSSSSPSSARAVVSRMPARSASSARLLQSGTQGAMNHLVSAEAYQYIDPSILKVLEKVDSQFSITNAINLSVALKKWLNSCVHVVCSTHLPTVMQSLLKRTCELLHCEHAALFTVDHAARKLRAICSERGDEHWELPLDKGIVGYAARQNVLCNVQRAYDDPRFYSSTDSITGTSSREVLCLPIAHDLQLQLATHLVNTPDSGFTTLGVFAVLRVWNTTHQKAFSTTDQILGGLLAIQAGVVLRQSTVTKTLQKINHKLHRILQMPRELVARASIASRVASGIPTSPETVIGSSIPATTKAPSPPSVVQLVAAAQKELAKCLDVGQLRIFVLDSETLQLWHVGEQLPPSDAGDGGQPTLVRRYVNAQASLCSLLLQSDPEPLVLAEPSADAAFNDTVDIHGGARGLYLTPIASPWGGALPLGMVQVARVAKARLSASPFALTAVETSGDTLVTGSSAAVAITGEREMAQQTEDRLMLELLDLFCRVFAGLLHHVTAQQLQDACPLELQQARLACLADRLRSLEQDNGVTNQDTQYQEEGITGASCEDAAVSPLIHLESECESNSRRTARRTSIAAVHSSPPPSRHLRRVASADSHSHSHSPTPAPVSRSATPAGVVPPSGLGHESQDGSRDGELTLGNDAQSGLQEIGEYTHADVNNGVHSGYELEAGHRIAQAQTQEEEEDAAALMAEHWDLTADDSGYAVPVEGEQAEDAMYTWEEGTVYDATWTTADQANGNADDTVWGYGEDYSGTEYALEHEEEHATSEDGDRDGRLSTGSAYAIQLDGGKSSFRHVHSAGSERDPTDAL